MAAIQRADLIVVGPGDLYGSILPNLLVRGITAALRRSRSKKVFVVNLMAKERYTTGFGVEDFLRILRHYLGDNAFDYVVYNSKRPPEQLLRRYRSDGVPIDGPRRPPRVGNPRYIGADLVNRTAAPKKSADQLSKERTFIRHDPDRLAKVLLSLK